MTFAALTTVLGVLENIISCITDITKLGRKSASLIVGVGIFLLSLPCILGFNVWSEFVPFAEGTGVLDLEDFVVSNLILPIGALIFSVFCTTRYGWGWKNFEAEANEGRGLKVAKWMRPIMTFVIPLMTLVVFIMGLLNFNFG
jgi:NSS family neurotransmitter:Na+ symporter